MRIVEFGPGLLHTKSVTVDGELSLFGSLEPRPAEPRPDLRDHPVGVRPGVPARTALKIQQSILSISSRVFHEPRKAWRARPAAPKIRRENAARLLESFGLLRFGGLPVSQESITVRGGPRAPSPTGKWVSRRLGARKRDERGKTPPEAKKGSGLSIRNGKGIEVHLGPANGPPWLAPRSRSGVAGRGLRPRRAPPGGYSPRRGTQRRSGPRDHRAGPPPFTARSAQKAAARGSSRPRRPADPL